MKLFNSIIATLLVSVHSFTPNHVPSSKATKLHETNVLEGREISNAFTPINNMLLVKKVDVVDQTEGGIFLTGKAKIEKSEGVVVAAGPGRTNSETGFLRPMGITVNEHVIFGKFNGEKVTYNGHTHTLIQDDDVLVKFEEGSDTTKVENAQVLQDAVLVKVEEVDIEATGGILIAATTKKTTISSIGEVLAVGPGRTAFNGELMEMDVEVGDMVKFRDYASQPVEIGKEDYAVLRMNDLIAKF